MATPHPAWRKARPLPGSPTPSNPLPQGERGSFFQPSPLHHDQLARLASFDDALFDDLVDAAHDLLAIGLALLEHPRRIDGRRLFLEQAQVAREGFERTRLVVELEARTLA